MDPRLDYLAKRKALVAVENALESLASDMHMTAKAIESWDTLLISEDAITNPPQTFGSGSPLAKIGLADWPSFDDFVALVKIWRQLREDAEDAYGKFSDYDGIESLPQKPSQKRHSQREYYLRLGGHAWLTYRSGK